MKPTLQQILVMDANTGVWKTAAKTGQLLSRHVENEHLGTRKFWAAMSRRDGALYFGGFDHASGIIETRADVLKMQFMEDELQQFCGGMRIIGAYGVSNEAMTITHGWTWKTGDRGEDLNDRLVIVGQCGYPEQIGWEYSRRLRLPSGLEKRAAEYWAGALQHVCKQIEASGKSRPQVVPTTFMAHGDDTIVKEFVIV